VSRGNAEPALLVLNQTLGPLAWELTEDLAEQMGAVHLFAGHRDAPELRDVTLFSGPAYDRAGAVRRLWSWLAYTAQALAWICRWPRDVPVLLFTNPPLLPILAGLLCRLRGQPYAVMVYDVYPDVLVHLGILRGTHPIVRIWKALNRRVYERAAAVITIGERMADTLCRQFDPARTRFGRVPHVYPWADTRVLRPLPKVHNPFAVEHAQVEALTVMYSGNMGHGHDLETLLTAAGRLRDLPSVHFMCIGGGAKWNLLARTVQEESLDNLTLLGWQSPEVLPCSLATADVAVVTLEEGMAGLALPSKTFSFLATGAALLAICPDASELATLICRFDCGWVIRPGDVDGFVDVVLRIARGEVDLAAVKRRSRQAAESIGSRENSASIAAILRTAFSTPGNPEAARPAPTAS
jgi:glycosyltransferase involved in cell wall biosynthesis